VKVAVPPLPAATEEFVQEIDPVDPAVGVVQLHAGPVFCVSDTKVVLVGTLSA